MAGILCYLSDSHNVAYPSSTESRTEDMGQIKSQVNYETTIPIKEFIDLLGLEGTEVEGVGINSSPRGIIIRTVEARTYDSKE